jgi:hypothetical protein
MKTSTQKTDSRALGAIATLIAILATLTINVLSNFFPPQGLNIGEIANTILNGVKITPANYAFAIWGLIYLGLIAYGIYQLRRVRENNLVLHRANSCLIVACLAQIVWVFLFTNRLFWFSVVAMVAILVSLIAAYLQLDIGRRRGSREQKWLVNMPFSVYLGWISVATIVNVASALYISQWDGWGISAEGWTAIMLVVGGIIGALVALQRGDLAFTLVFIWAYIAIAIRQATSPPIWITAVIVAIALAACLVFGVMKHKTSKFQQHL